MDPVKEFIESSKALQRKYEELRLGKISTYHALQESYKPLIEPLKDLGTRIERTSIAPLYPRNRKFIKRKSQELGGSSSEDERRIVPIRKPFEELIVGEVAGKYLKKYFSTDSTVDRSFGIYVGKDNKFHVGDKKVQINENDLTIGDKFYEGTIGLWELLTSKNPKNYTPTDLEKYAEIVKYTNTGYVGNDPSNKKKASGGGKYKKIIKNILEEQVVVPSLPDESSSSSSENEANTSTLKNIVNKILRRSTSESSVSAPEKVTGSGLRKIYTNTPVEYVYWNTLDELLERLYIVYGEIKAGNSSPNLLNELVNILMEIKEI